MKYVDELLGWMFQFQFTFNWQVQRWGQSSDDCIAHLSTINTSEWTCTCQRQTIIEELLKFDHIQYYKVLNNLTCINPNIYFQLHNPQPSSCNPASFLQISSTFNNNLQFTFFMGLLGHVNCSNDLPSIVKQSSSLSPFKRQIKLINLNMYTCEAVLLFCFKLIFLYSMFCWYC